MTGPTPLSPRQAGIVLVCAIAIALTRLLATAHSLMDWDEALFAIGVGNYDVAHHQPHPPGYPLFVAPAKLLHAMSLGEFRAVQVLVLAGAAGLFPALFFLAREIGFGFATAVCGAALFAFLPNVWVYGGTGLSDVPSTMLSYLACGLLLKGRRHVPSYLLGALALGIVGGIRPANVAIGFVPALMATWPYVRVRAWRPMAAAAVLGGAVIAGSYLGAALASQDVSSYAQAVANQRTYVREVDSYQNPHRPPLPDLGGLFFLWPFDAPALMTGILLLAALSLAAAIDQRRRPPLVTLVVFTPFAILVWLGLNYHTASRYAIPYLALHTLLAADGLRSLGRSAWFQSLGTAALIGTMAAWTWPALARQRTTDSPPVAALNWVRAHVPATATVYVHGAMRPQAAFYLPDRHLVFYDSTGEVSLFSTEACAIDLRRVEEGETFSWPRTDLWNVLRRRYFETSVTRSTGTIRFDAGWYATEGEGAAQFRWMAREASAALPSLKGAGRLSLRLYVPLDALTLPPTIDISFNGQPLERIDAATPDLAWTWTLPSRPDVRNELRLRTSETVVPARVRGTQDTRALGIRLDELSWTPATPSISTRSTTP